MKKYEMCEGRTQVGFGRIKTNAYLKLLAQNVHYYTWDLSRYFSLR